jgi:hypothetical protein
MPTTDFRIDEQGGWATARFSVTQLSNLEWLGGRGYSHFGFYIHDTEVKISQEGKQKDIHLAIYGNGDGKDTGKQAGKQMMKQTKTSTITPLLSSKATSFRFSSNIWQIQSSLGVKSLGFPKSTLPLNIT